MHFFGREPPSDCFCDVRSITFMTYKFISLKLNKCYGECKKLGNMHFLRCIIPKISRFYRIFSIITGFYKYYKGSSINDVPQKIFLNPIPPLVEICSPSNRTSLIATTLSPPNGKDFLLLKAILQESILSAMVIVVFVTGN